MSPSQGFVLHPGAAQDISEIWHYIAEQNPHAARRVREDVLDAIRKLAPFPHQGHERHDLTCGSKRFTTTLSPTRPMKILSW